MRKKNLREEKGLFLAGFGLAFFVLVFAGGKIFSSAPERKLGKATTPIEETLLLNHKGGRLAVGEAKKIFVKLAQPIVIEHTVGRNEWLEKIAREYGVPAISIRSTNNLEDPVLRPGQKILAQNKKGIFHISKKDEPLEAIIQSYKRLGAKREKILQSNDLAEITFMDGDELYMKEGGKLLIPDTHQRFPWLSMPVRYRRVSSVYGWRRHPILRVRRYHDGYDMVAPYGAPVYAGEAGVVVQAGWEGHYGKVVKIRHNKTTTLYGHLSKIYVKEGQKVKRKQLIGRVGSTGLSTGPHLHFEVRSNATGKSQDPRRYLY